MNQPQYRVVWPTVTKPMIGMIVAFVVLWLASLQGAPLHDLARDSLTLTAPAVTERYAIWSMATYAFFHPDFFSVLFSGIAIWLFGGELSTRWSAARFWGAQAAAALLGGVLCFAGLWALDSPLTVQGYHAAAMALVFSFCWRVWRVPQHFFFVQMTGRTMLLVFVGFGAIMAIIGGYWPTLVLDAAGIAVGFVASTGTLNIRDLRTRVRLWQARRKLKIVRTPEDDKTPKRKNSDGMYIN